jgi:SAM-dependent methyltransferase
MREKNDPWGEQTAKSYDTPGTGMFAPEVLGPAIDRLAQLAEGGAALEFAIGTGRVAVPLRQRGIAVSGIELSPAMIAQLRTKADEATIPVTLGDMATARAPGTFMLAFVVFNGISNLLTQDDQIACFRNAARHLGRGGRFVVELWVPELRKLPIGQTAIVATSEPGHFCVDEYEVLQQRVVSNHFFFGQSHKATTGRSHHRYIWPAELDLMAQIAGFELESRHADWSGTAFTAESYSHVSVYRLVKSRVAAGQPSRLQNSTLRCRRAEFAREESGAL